MKGKSRFDPAGNLIDPIATQASQVKDNLIREYQGKRYSYDAQGNVIETQQGNKTLKLTWDNLNRLIQSDHNGRITYYGYDVFGRRLYKKSQDQNGKDHLILFGWDGDLMVWESKTVTDHKDLNSQQYNKDNSENKQDYTKHYIYEPNSFVPALQAGYSQFINLIETPDYSQFKTMPYSIHRDPVWNTETRKQRTELERVAFYHCDQVGTPQSLSNELGECVWSIRQSTWGKAEEITKENPDNPFEQTEIRFQGQYYDEETGLHYNRYRYYEPHSARYISKDPIGLQGGLNNSAYVSDPNQWVDPRGLEQFLGLHNSEMRAVEHYLVFQRECVERTGKQCPNTHRGAPAFDYLFCTNGMPTASGAGYQNLVTERIIDAPDRVAKNKLEITCGFGHILNKDSKAIRSDEIDVFLESKKKVVLKPNANLGKKGILSFGTGFNILTQKDKSILNTKIAFEGKFSTTVVSPKKKIGKKVVKNNEIF